LKTRHRTSRLVRDNNVEVNETSSAIEQRLLVGRLDDTQWSGGSLLWNRKPRTHGTNHRRAKSQTEPLQSSHGRTSTSDRLFR
jgi:hypothetical protein